jgi:hypothetical protein
MPKAAIHQPQMPFQHREQDVGQRCCELVVRSATAMTLAKGMWKSEQHDFQVSVLLDDLHSHS